jgi:hypothetical protein
MRHAHAVVVPVETGVAGVPFTFFIPPWIRNLQPSECGVVHLRAPETYVYQERLMNALKTAVFTNLKCLALDSI